MSKKRKAAEKQQEPSKTVKYLRENGDNIEWEAQIDADGIMALGVDQKRAEIFNLVGHFGDLFGITQLAPLTYEEDGEEQRYLALEFVWDEGDKPVLPPLTREEFVEQFQAWVGAYCEQLFDEFHQVLIDQKAKEIFDAAGVS